MANRLSQPKVENPWERLLLLTLVLEQSLEEEDWTSVDGLFDQREAAIDEALAAGAPNAQLAAKLQACESRMSSRLREGRRLIAEALQKGATGRRAMTAYSANGRGASSTVNRKLA